MSHNFIGIMLDSHHYTSPFSCPCEDNEARGRHSLSLGQRVVTVALSILVAIPTFGVGGIASFYILSAAFKARNNVWIEYTAQHQKYHNRITFIQPAYWGVRVAVPRRHFSTRSDGFQTRSNTHSRFPDFIGHSTREERPVRGWGFNSRGNAHERGFPASDRRAQGTGGRQVPGNGQYRHR